MWQQSIIPQEQRTFAREPLHMNKWLILTGPVPLSFCPKRLQRFDIWYLLQVKQLLESFKLLSASMHFRKCFFQGKKPKLRWSGHYTVEQQKCWHLRYKSCCLARPRVIYVLSWLMSKQLQNEGSCYISGLYQSSIITSSKMADPPDRQLF